jgi:A/G-specific adenine glycosylase
MIASQIATTEIQKNLIAWFRKNARDLPWRHTKDPYAIWVSEIMLQQTQVSTVVPYYERFLKSFPTVKDLAGSPLLKVLKAWEGLGYYSRARSLHAASRTIFTRFGGKVPGSERDLLSLPGVGRYTAGAILSIAFNKDAPVLDANVRRVLSRLFAVSEPPGAGRERDLWNLSESMVPKGRAASFNQALMDLGATVCLPKRPHCTRCPIHGLCGARESGHPEDFPEKAVKKRTPHVEAVAAVILKNGCVLLNQRPPKGLLGGLWEFPNWATEGKKDLIRLLRRQLATQAGVRVNAMRPVGAFRQTYSHFSLTLHAYSSEVLDADPSKAWIPVDEVHLLPMSAIHRRIAQKIGINPAIGEENGRGFS